MINGKILRIIAFFSVISRGLAAESGTVSAGRYEALKEFAERKGLESVGDAYRLLLREEGESGLVRIENDYKIRKSQVEAEQKAVEPPAHEPEAQSEVEPLADDSETRAMQERLDQQRRQQEVLAERMKEQQLQFKKQIMSQIEVLDGQIRAAKNRVMSLTSTMLDPYAGRSKNEYGVWEDNGRFQWSSEQRNAEVLLRTLEEQREQLVELLNQQ